MSYLVEALFDPQVIRMRSFANTRHAGQKYGTEFPYVLHLQAVDGVLVRFGAVGVHYLVCGWGHDLLEDTDTTRDEIAALWGNNVAACIEAVSEPKEGNRRQRQEAAYPKIIAHGLDAITVKLADRISHVESGGAKINMYRKEHPWFRSMIYQSDFTGHSSQHAMSWIIRMQDHLDDLIVRV